MNGGGENRFALPFVHPALSFILGVLAYNYFFHFGTIITGVAILGVLIVVVGKYSSSARRSVFQIFIYCFLFLLLGLLRSHFANKHTQIDEGFYNYTLEVESVKKGNNTVQLFGKLKRYKVKDEWVSLEEPIICYTKDRSLPVQCGGQLLIKAKIQSIQGKLNPHAFDYAQFMKRRGVYYQSFVRNGNILVLGEQNLSWADQIKSFCKTELEEHIENRDALTIANSLLLGDRAEVDKDLLGSYANAGVIHVLAVSGLHVGLLYGSLLFLLSFFGNGFRNRLLKMVMYLLFIWGYSIPVLRASFMISALIISDAFNRHTSRFNSLCFSAWILLFYKPNYLYEIGFQFSFLAIAGILILYPYISRWISSRNAILNKVWNLIAVCISAQILIFPLSTFYFHQFSNYFILSNLLVLPLIGIVVPLGFIFLLSSPVPIVQEVLGIIVELLILSSNWLVKRIDSLPGAVFQNLYFSPAQAFLFFGLTVCVVAMLITRRFKFAVYTLLLSILFFFASAKRELILRDSHQIVSYALYKNYMTDFILSENRVSVGSTELSEKDKNRMIPNRLYHRVLHTTPTDGVLKEDNENYTLVCYNGKSYFFPKKKPLLTQSLFIDVEFLTNKKLGSKLIRSDTKVLNSYCSDSLDGIHCLKTRGAFDQAL